VTLPTSVGGNLSALFIEGTISRASFIGTISTPFNMTTSKSTGLSSNNSSLTVTIQHKTSSGSSVTGTIQTLFLVGTST
jgi:hypothetical protein